MHKGDFPSNDIALLKLVKDVEIDGFIQMPLCLPETLTTEQVIYKLEAYNFFVCFLYVVIKPFILKPLKCCCRYEIRYKIKGRMSPDGALQKNQVHVLPIVLGQKIMSNAESTS